MAHCTTQYDCWRHRLDARPKPNQGTVEIGRVSKIYPGKDGKVRKVEVQYKNPRPCEPVTKYDGRGYVTVERAVHRLIVLLPEKRTIETNQTDRFLPLIINSKSVIFFLSGGVYR